MQNNVRCPGKQLTAASTPTDSSQASPTPSTYDQWLSSDDNDNENASSNHIWGEMTLMQCEAFSLFGSYVADLCEALSNLI